MGWLKTAIKTVLVFVLALAIIVFWFLARVGSDELLDKILPSFALFALDILLALSALAALFALAAMFAPRTLGLGHPPIAFALAGAGYLAGLLTSIASFAEASAVATVLTPVALTIIFTALPIKPGTRGESRKPPFVIRALIRARKSAVCKTVIWLASVILSLALVPFWASHFFASDEIFLYRFLYRLGVPDFARNALYTLELTLPLLATPATLGIFLTWPKLGAGKDGETTFAIRALGQARNSRAFKIILWLGVAALILFSSVGIMAALAAVNIESGYR